MPGGAFAFVANTYSNLEDNIMPAVQKGWQLMGLIEGVHYVKDVLAGWLLGAAVGLLGFLI